MSSAVPMNRQARRAAGDTSKQAVETVPLMLVVAKRLEYRREDGATMAKLYLSPVTANGRPLLEDEAIDGPLPWVFESRPIMIRRPPKIFTGPGLVRP